MNKCVVYPIFPIVLGTYKVIEDLSELDNVANLEFNNKGNDGSYNASVSKDFKLLDSFPNIKNIICNYFTDFKNKVLKFTDTEFVMTTSWATKTLSKGYSQFHSHKNCYYSGIIYWQDNVGTANLEFENSHGSQFLINPKVNNTYNSDKFVLPYQKNYIAFFPSYLSHRIGVNESNQIRYSIAYNFYPIGILGNGDSSVSVLVKDF
jgi:uncharacterized protein (TIGR02466 family)